MKPNTELKLKKCFNIYIMVVKKPVLKKRRKVRKGKTTTAITKKGKGGNVSQVVNVYVSKTTRQRRATAPKQFMPAIQPQMYNAGQDNMILGLKQQNQTLMEILDRQRKTDTTPSSDIFTLDDIANMKSNKPSQSSTGDYTDKTIYESESGFKITEKEKIPKKNLVIDTTERQNISSMLSSIAKGMDEIPQSEGIKQRIFEIGDKLRPTSVMARVAKIDDLDEMGKLELEYDGLVKQLQEQRKYDNTIRMANYTNRLPNKVSTLTKKITDMRNTLNRSIDKMGDQAL
tara:strand:+ start:1862 stop:2722 length:861 start_codon:yes stop_codon:yes gene_type:complete